MPEPIVLRPLTAEDLPVLRRWRRMAAFRDAVLAELAAEAPAPPSPSGGLALSIHRAEDGALIGLAALAPIDAASGEADVHIFVAELGAGYGEAAARAMLGYAFEEMGLWRARLAVRRDDELALRGYAACGFEPAPSEDSTLASDFIAMRVTEAVFRSRQPRFEARWALG
ncbi:MAG: GNAT family N-acetyltransferase [Caulobacteraceae bacterium]|nr:GNAT family N-acetyltransferase [Caulobacteraceae bacterium]